MALSRRRSRSPLHPQIGAKFFLVIGVLVPAVLAIAGVGSEGLRRMADRTSLFYESGFTHSQNAADVLAATYAMQETAMHQVAVSDRAGNAELSAELDQVLIPRLRTAIAVLREGYRDEPGNRATAEQIETGLETFVQLRGTGMYNHSDRPLSASARTALAARTGQMLDPMVERGQELRAVEARDAARIEDQSLATYRSTLFWLGLCSGLVLLLGLLVVLALIRNMVPRIRRYSQFAADVAAGRPTSPLQPRGGDELAELGEALNDMVLQREQADAGKRQQRELVTESERAQAEFVDTLQVTRNEDEAQELLQRHLERSLAGSAVAVLRGNNSANRLQAATALPPGSELATALMGAEPRSCVAVRLGRTHQEGTGRQPLLGCTLCAAGSAPTHCEPLVVGGEVIGSVLVNQPAAFDDTDESRIKNTVGQAAPVLANLRSLALAEFRANNDSLTGLPNKRATEDTVKRMVAQAGRSLTPLAAVMLDLDHFKAINDRFGHALGDEVLAAVGTAIDSSLRASDFAGRFGGEEFLILLPDTPLEAAWQVAEKVRRAVASVSIPGVEREITASLGVAGLLEHAGNATGLLREADRAQYAAKAAGRNRTVIAADTPSHLAEPLAEGHPDAELDALT